jgi:hypothetical protein
MACYRPAEYILQDVLYVADNGRSLPAILLYTADDLGYCQFSTEAWGHYDGLGYYSTAAIHLEYLRPADGKPLGTRDQARQHRDELRLTEAPKKPHPSKPAVSQMKADGNHRDVIRKISREHRELKKEMIIQEPSAPESLTKYKIPTLELGGLSLADYLGNR